MKVQIISKQIIVFFRIMSLNILIPNENKASAFSLQELVMHASTSAGRFFKGQLTVILFFLWLQVMHAPTTAGRSYKGQLAYDLGTHGQFQNTLYCVYNIMMFSTSLS